MKKILTAFSVCILLFLCACAPPSATQVEFSVMPKELKDCTFFRLADGNSTTIYVTRCPNSATTTSTISKSPTHAVVVDGVSFEPAQPKLSEPK